MLATAGLGCGFRVNDMASSSEKNRKRSTQYQNANQARRDSVPPGLIMTKGAD